MNTVLEFRQRRLEALLKPRDEFCWECGCGSQHFLLIKGGDVVCVECEMICTRLRHFDTTVPFNA